jgi:hypothetical protein
VFGSRCPVGRKALQHFDNIDVARDDPSVQERIPMNGSFAAQAMKQRVGIRENLRVQEMIETESSARALQPGNGFAFGRHY